MANVNYRGCGCGSCGCSGGCGCGRRPDCSGCSSTSPCKRASCYRQKYCRPDYAPVTDERCLGALNSVFEPFERVLAQYALNGRAADERAGDPYACYPFYGGPCGPSSPCRRCCCRDLPYPYPPYPEYLTDTAYGAYPASSSCSGCSTCSGCSGCSICSGYAASPATPAAPAVPAVPATPSCPATPACPAYPADPATSIETGISGSFSAYVPLSVCAGGIIPLTAAEGNSPELGSSQGGVRIARAGTYMVVYTLRLPLGQGLTTQLYLNLNGVEQAGSRLCVAVPDGGASQTLTMQALVQTPADALLTLNSSSAFSLPASTASFSLSIVKVS